MWWIVASVIIVNVGHIWIECAISVMTDSDVSCGIDTRING